MGYVSGQPTWRSMWLVTEDPLKSFVSPLHLVLIPNENLTIVDYIAYLHRQVQNKLLLDQVMSLP